MDALKDLQGDLRSIAEVMGRQQALYLISQCPRYKVAGRQGAQVLLYVPKTKNFDISHHIVQSLGYHDAYKLSQHFGGELLVLSQCRHIILKVRNEGIKSLVNLGISKKEVAELFGVSQRTIGLVAAA